MPERPDDVSVGPCADGEWEAVVSLLHAVYADEGYVPCEHAARSYTRERLTAGGLVLVARDSTSVLGVVVLTYPGGTLSGIARQDEVEFRMLAVAPSGRGRGVGERLVRACLDRAASEPFCADRVVLWTQPSMNAAQRLYERLGFARAPERDAVRPALVDGAPPVTQLVYARSIGA